MESETEWEEGENGTLGMGWKSETGDTGMGERVGMGDGEGDGRVDLGHWRDGR